MFQATRPFDKWSRLDNRRHIEYGCSNAVDSVTPTPRCLVAVVMIGTMVDGSCVGHCTAHLTIASDESSCVLYGASSSAMNIASKRPRSMVRAICCQYSGREKSQPTLSFGCRHMPVAWLLTPCCMNPRRWVFFLLGIVILLPF